MSLFSCASFCAVILFLLLYIGGHFVLRLLLCSSQRIYMHRISLFFRHCLHVSISPLRFSLCPQYSLSCSIAVVCFFCPPLRNSYVRDTIFPLISIPKKYAFRHETAWGCMFISSPIWYLFGDVCFFKTIALFAVFVLEP